MTEQRRRVEKACAELVTAGEAFTFTAVAARAGVGRATLYRKPELRAVVEEHRARNCDADTLSGLAEQVAQLRTSLEAVAAQVRGMMNRFGACHPGNAVLSVAISRLTAVQGTRRAPDAQPHRLRDRPRGMIPQPTCPLNRGKLMRLSRVLGRLRVGGASPAVPGSPRPPNPGETSM